MRQHSAVACMLHWRMPVAPFRHVKLMQDAVRAGVTIGGILKLSTEFSSSVTRYWNVTVAMARLTLSGGQKVTGPGTAPGVAILVPWPGWLRICSPAAFDTL